jgi:hypothetical protein
MAGKKGMRWGKRKKGKSKRRRHKARWSSTRQRYILDITGMTTLKSVLVLLIIMIIIIIALEIGAMIFAEMR